MQLQQRAEAVSASQIPLDQWQLTSDSQERAAPEVPQNILIRDCLLITL